MPAIEEKDVFNFQNAIKPLKILRDILYTITLHSRVSSVVKSICGILKGGLIGITLHSVVTACNSTTWFIFMLLHINVI